MMISGGRGPDAKEFNRTISKCGNIHMGLSYVGTMNKGQAKLPRDHAWMSQ